ncbi:MAG: ThuA domain-containing protein [Candidatus Glassbacteria bacterium]|nr:ThuA domain-containing protein [Candidatus Glassbacteria bacterium]
MKRRANMWKMFLPALLLGALLLATGCSEDETVSDRVDSRGLGGGPVTPADVNVLLLGQDDLSGFAFVQGYLTPFGFPVVDTYDNTIATPTLADLSAYQAVMVWTDGSPASVTALGDLLADYVDAGGGVVVATYGHAAGYGVGGTFAAGGYSPFNFDAVNPNTVTSMSTVYDAAHPIMAGVVSLGVRYRDNPTVAPDGIVLADWAAGNAAIGVNATGTVVGLAMSPVDGGNLTGNYPELFSNALTFTASN